MKSDELRSKLSRVDSSMLATFLARLAGEDASLRERIEALALREEPSQYARSLASRLKRLGSGHAFITYGESGAFAHELDSWLDDVETLLESDPETGWKLSDQFIRTDAQVIENADDSDGSIGDVYRRACGLWHRAAAALPADPGWVDRVRELHAGNDYGTRDALLDEAATRLSELELRRLASIYEQEAASRPKSRDSFRGLSAAAAMGQVACALGDASLYERSVHIRSPRPNSLQAEDIAQQYLRFGPVERAVEWLTRSEDRAEGRGERLELLAQAYEQLGNRELLLDSRRRIAEETLSLDTFARYEALLPEHERPAARQRAIERVSNGQEPVGAALFLFELGEPDRAAALALRERERLRSSFYGNLIALAERFEKSHTLAAIVCYRTLVEQILDQGRSKAYRHAKHYVDRLVALHPRVDGYGDLVPHAEYLAELRSRHGRKHSFWSLFGRQQRC